MIIFNPTKSDITIKVNGIEYTAPAESEVSGIPEEVALHWKTRIHQFVEVREEKKRTQEAVAKEIEEVKPKK